MLARNKMRVEEEPFLLPTRPWRTAHGSRWVGFGPGGCQAPIAREVLACASFPASTVPKNRRDAPAKVPASLRPIAPSTLDGTKASCGDRQFAPGALPPTAPTAPCHPLQLQSKLKGVH